MVSALYAELGRVLTRWNVVECGPLPNSRRRVEVICRPSRSTVDGTFRLFGFG